MIKNVYRSPCQAPVILVRFKWNFNFLNIFSKNTQISNLMKIRLVGSEFFHVDEQTERQTEANSRFPQFRTRA